MTEPAQEPPIVSLSFRCVSGAKPYIDGVPTSSLYTEKRGLKERVAALIEEGKLTLRGAARPRLLSIRGGGGFYVALLDDGIPRTLPAEQPRMQPLTAFDEERLLLKLMEGGLHSEFAEIAGGPSRAAGRTVVILDRGRAMAEPWALWGELPKLRVAGFLADASLLLRRNSTLLSFASTPRWESGAAPATPDPSEAAWGPALAEALLVAPDRLLAVTDGSVGRHEPAGLLAELAESGVKVQVVVVAGVDELPQRGWAKGVCLHELRTAGDLASLIHGRLLS